MAMFYHHCLIFSLLWFILLHRWICNCALQKRVLIRYIVHTICQVVPRTTMVKRLFQQWNPTGCVQGFGASSCIQDTFLLRVLGATDYLPCVLYFFPQIYSFVNHPLYTPSQQGADVYRICGFSCEPDLHLLLSHHFEEFEIPIWEGVDTRLHLGFSSIILHVQTKRLNCISGLDSILPHRPWQAICFLELQLTSWLSGPFRSTNAWERYFLEWLHPSHFLHWTLHSWFCSST